MLGYPIYLFLLPQAHLRSRNRFLFPRLLSLSTLFLYTFLHLSLTVSSAFAQQYSLLHFVLLFLQSFPSLNLLLWYLPHSRIYRYPRRSLCTSCFLLLLITVSRKNERGCSGHLDYLKFLFILFSSKRRRRGLNADSQLNYELEELNLLLPSMHLQWLNSNSTVALINVNPVSGTYHVLAQSRTREQMVENAAVLVRVLRRAHASRFKKYQEELEHEKAER